MCDSRERLEIIIDIPRPHREDDKPHATPWFERPDGKLMRTLIVPEGMSIETARSIVDDVENTTD
jgi:hypothetical protein